MNQEQEIEELKTEVALLRELEEERKDRLAAKAMARQEADRAMGEIVFILSLVFAATLLVLVIFF